VLGSSPFCNQHSSLSITDVSSGILIPTFSDFKLHTMEVFTIGSIIVTILPLPLHFLCHIVRPTYMDCPVMKHIATAILLYFNFNNLTFHLVYVCMFSFCRAINCQILINMATTAHENPCCASLTLLRYVFNIGYWICKTLKL
jgi:hypothetical protein